MRTSSLVLGFLYQFLVASHAHAILPFKNPLNATIPKFHWSMELEDVVTIPDSSPGIAPRLEFLTGGGTTGLAYVLDQRGKIYVFDTTAASPTASLFLDLSVQVPSFVDDDYQKGVRGLAFHPDFDVPGAPGYRRFYTSHSRSTGSSTVGTPSPVVFSAPNPSSVDHYSIVAEWAVTPSGTVDLNSYRELLFIGQTEVDHNIAQISFNPNAAPSSADYGNLYISLPDGGGAGDPYDVAQDISKPFGSFLRIDPLISGSNSYSVPSDNPFKVSVDPTISENIVWAYGMRNPHRFTFDTAGDGEMIFVDIGQGSVEEINLGVAGANYGWGNREGTFITTGSFDNVDYLPANHAIDAYTYPVAQYDHNNNLVLNSSAVVGGAVYRGANIPQLTGLYLFGDFSNNSGPIMAVDVDDLIERDDFTNLTSLYDGHLAPFGEIQLTFGGVEKSLRQIIADETGQNESRTDLRFGVGPDNEIYILDKHDGVVRRIVSVSGLLDGDADRDGDVDSTDLERWEAGYGMSGDWSDGNFNGDQSVDGVDFFRWQRNLISSSALQSVPEPKSLVSFGLALFLLFSVPRKFTRNRNQFFE